MRNENVSSSNKDMTEMLGMSEELKSLESEVFENMSETQKNFYNKMNIILDFRNKIFELNFRKTIEVGYCEMIKNIMSHCRSSCIDLKTDHFNEGEKKCVKSCAYKYVQQFEVHNKFISDYQDKHPINFLYDEGEKKAFEKMMELINSSDRPSV